jgi:hypothetical protein
MSTSAIGRIRRGELEKRRSCVGETPRHEDRPQILHALAQEKSEPSNQGEPQPDTD